MAHYFIRSGTLVDNGSFSENYGFFIRNGKITTASPRTGTELKIIDAEGLIIAPGFIDLHVHGGNGADVLDGTPETLGNIAAFHARHGTTGMLPTIAAAPWKQMLSALQAAREATVLPVDGARILGVHLEGPFLNPARKGAQNKDCLLMPDLTVMKTLAAAAGGRLRIVTLAPELPGAIEVIRWLAGNGIIPAAGHTNATFEQMTEAVVAGLKHVTHIFNAMAPIHHREPGPVGAALTFPDLSIEVIGDGVHIHPALLKLLHQLKGDGWMALVTDAIRAAGKVNGTFQFAGQTVTVQNGQARLPDGTLTGSTLTMLQGVKNLVKMSGLTLPQAVRLASTNPAVILGLEHCKGRIASGYDADLLLLDQNLELKMVMVEGKIHMNYGNYGDTILYNNLIPLTGTFSFLKG